MKNSLLFCSLFFSISLFASEMSNNGTTASHEADLKKLIAELNYYNQTTWRPISPFWPMKKEKVQAFLQKWPDVHPDAIRYQTRSSGDDRPLYEAVVHQDQDMVQFLVDRRASAKCQPNRRKYQLPILFHAKSVELAQLLLKHNADVNAHDRDGDTVLRACAASDEKPKELIVLYGRHGADTMRLNDSGETPLHYLSAEKDIEKMKAFIAIGVPLEPTRNSYFYAFRYGLRTASPTKLNIIEEFHVRMRDETIEPLFFKHL